MTSLYSNPKNSRNNGVIFVPLFVILLVIFLYLVSISTFDEQKSSQVQESLNDTFYGNKAISNILHNQKLFADWHDVKRITLSDLAVQYKKSPHITMANFIKGRFLELNIAYNAMFFTPESLTPFAKNFLTFTLKSLQYMQQYSNNEHYDITIELPYKNGAIAPRNVNALGKFLEDHDSSYNNLNIIMNYNPPKINHDNNIYMRIEKSS